MARRKDGRPRSIPLDKRVHEHEAWQLQESASGGMYCAACGAHVDTKEENKK